MFDKYLLETNGFRNTYAGGQATGFQFNLRIAYYRGISLAILAGLRVIVDGHEVDPQAIRLIVAGQAFDLPAASRAESVRWEFDEAIVVQIDLPGGLASGRHTLEVEQRIKPAYMPQAVNFVGHARREMTLVDHQELGQLPGRITLGVSLYSYQEEYYTKSLTLENCLAEVQSIGATGVQLLPEQMMRGYPNPSREWLMRWEKGLAENNLTPTTMSTFVDVDCGGHRHMSLAEGVAQLVDQMTLAKRLGFSIIRPTTGPVEDAAPELVMRALDDAERLGVSIAPEIHAPIELTGRYIDSYLDLIERTGTKRLGFTLDLGIFCHEIPLAAREQAIRFGAQPELVSLVDRAFRQGKPQSEVLAEVQSRGGNEAAVKLARHYRAFGPPSNRVADLSRVLPHVRNVHGKFYVVGDDGVEASIPYAEVLNALIRGGYSGSIDSEYEGQRLTQDAFDTDSCEQVRRHHLMMRQILSTAEQ